VNPAELRDVLEHRGAVMRGHFILSSGRHSDVFVQKFRVLEDPRLTQRFGEAIAGTFPDGFDVVVSPAVGAILLGFATAMAAGTRMIFAEREQGIMQFRRGFRLAPRERALVVEDVITTGGSAREVVELVRASGGEPVGIGALIEREDPARFSDLGVPLRALVSVDAPSWSARECPLCTANEPVTDPGSRRLAT
jgi:orotate phosphoribosyltransferase